ncbi:hypothetical protein [Bacillus wiedmannii]|uniref:hypothetical protein n=1 Tax=Bacillus wiedmannii TaxID=1890302 RepID=UPI0021D1261C|nr:hypothetical protein [Bacillus wiedmannii]MCU5096130.1 hypothetical protein [Bacillus wiedmannii]
MELIKSNSFIRKVQEEARQQGRIEGHKTAIKVHITTIRGLINERKIQSDELLLSDEVLANKFNTSQKLIKEIKSEIKRGTSNG